MRNLRDGDAARLEERHVRRVGEPLARQLAEQAERDRLVHGDVDVCADRRVTFGAQRVFVVLDDVVTNA